MGDNETSHFCKHRELEYWSMALQGSLNTDPLSFYQRTFHALPQVHPPSALSRYLWGRHRQWQAARSSVAPYPRLIMAPFSRQPLLHAPPKQWHDISKQTGWCDPNTALTAPSTHQRSAVPQIALIDGVVGAAVLAARASAHSCMLDMHCEYPADTRLSTKWCAEQGSDGPCDTARVVWSRAGDGGSGVSHQVSWSALHSGIS